MITLHGICAVKLILLGFGGLVTAIVDTLAGGGGLITLPILLISGLPPVAALGTSRFQACIGELNASIHFFRHGGVKAKDIFPGVIFAGIGAMVGTILIQYVHPVFLNKLIPFLLLTVLIYFLAIRKFLKQKEHQRLSPTVFYATFGTLIGFYNGFLGPGTGSFWVVAFMFFLGFDLKKATLSGKPLNFVGDFGSLVCFILFGAIDYKIGIIMAIGQLIGSHIGAKLVIYKGAKVIEPVFISMISVMIISLFVKFYL